MAVEKVLGPFVLWGAGEPGLLGHFRSFSVLGPEVHVGRVLRAAGFTFDGWKNLHFEYQLMKPRGPCSLDCRAIEDLYLNELSVAGCNREVWPDGPRGKIDYNIMNNNDINHNFKRKFNLAIQLFDN